MEDGGGVRASAHPALCATARDFLRLETLHAANDEISNEIAALPAFHLSGEERRQRNMRGPGLAF
jgi:hypothetical protein